jgi:quercetin dioxygenase-like cupin family protein
MVMTMTKRSVVILLVVSLIATATAPAQPPAGPVQILKAETGDVAASPRHELLVYTAVVGPGEVTPWHIHPSPLVLYVESGVFVLEVEGKPPIIAKTGEAILEPVNVVVRGKNGDTHNPTRVVLFNVAKPGEPLIKPASK